MLLILNDVLKFMGFFGSSGPSQSNRFELLSLRLVVLRPFSGGLSIVTDSAAADVESLLGVPVSALTSLRTFSEMLSS